MQHAAMLVGENDNTTCESNLNPEEGEEGNGEEELGDGSVECDTESVIDTDLRVEGELSIGEFGCDSSAMSTKPYSQSLPSTRRRLRGAVNIRWHAIGYEISTSTMPQNTPDTPVNINVSQSRTIVTSIGGLHSIGMRLAFLNTVSHSSTRLKFLKKFATRPTAVRVLQTAENTRTITDRKSDIPQAKVASRRKVSRGTSTLMRRRTTNQE